MAEKEVKFWDYCNKCIDSNTKETDDPCDTCLGNPVNEDSNKPVMFRPKD